MSDTLLTHFISGKPFHLGTFPSQLVPDRRIIIIGKYKPNKKTGEVIQLSLLDADLSPKEDLALARADETYLSAHGCDSGCTSFYGCYVSSFAFHFKSIDNNWLLWSKEHDEAVPELSESDQSRLFSGKTIRFGEYGDPASVSLDVIERIASYASDHLGYTHRWRSCEPGFARFCMASVESTSDYVHAMARGYRPFLVVPAGTTRKQIQAEITAGTPTPCVHDIDETQCVNCPTPCNGTSWASRKAGIYVIAHGRNKGKLTH